MRVVVLLLAFSCFLSLCGVTPRILVKFPTRMREKQFFNCLDLYYKFLSRRYVVNFLITCDDDDIVMNNSRVRDRFKQYQNLKVIYGKSFSKIHACNRDMNKAPDFDILILASDDMNPVVKNYDAIIVEEMLKHFPNYDGILNFNDGHTKDNLNTLAILGKKYYKRFNYIYHSVYKSFFCDLEMTIVSKILKKEVYIDKVVIVHDNPVFGNVAHDKLFDLNHKFWYQDRYEFFNRMSFGFGLKSLKSCDYNIMHDLSKGI